MMLGFSIFSFIFILAYNLPLEPPYECTLLQAEPTTDIKLTSPRKQGSLFHELTVPTLRNFSKILPSKTICLSRDIGVNALAGVFVLYITIIVMTISRTKLLDTAMIFLCFGYTLIMSSRGSLIILSGIIIWVLLLAVKQHYFKARPLLSSRQIICIVVAFLVVLLVTYTSVLSYITNQSRYILLILSIEEILKEPLLGHGLGSKLTEGVKHSIYPHGFILASWFLMGILGLLSSLAIFLTLIVYFVRSSIILLCDDRINYEFTLASIFLFSPILTLLIRGSVESIFLISDWVSLAIYLSLANQSTTNRHTT